MSNSRQFHLTFFQFLTFVFVALDLSSCNPLTKRQMQKVYKLLEESIAKAVPTDADAASTDILLQQKFDTKNLTYYYGGDKKLPVFISFGTSRVGKPLHVLLRGEDYVGLKDENNFVVLKKLAAPEGAYSVHLAHVPNMGKKLFKGAKVIWNDVRIEQQKDVEGLLQSIGNAEAQARSTRSHRPLCDWLGYTLICAAPHNVAPLRDRKKRIPLDEEEEAPVNLFGVTQSETKRPKKRFTLFSGGKSVSSDEAYSSEKAGEDEFIEVDSTPEGNENQSARGKTSETNVKTTKEDQERKSVAAVVIKKASL